MIDLKVYCNLNTKIFEVCPEMLAVGKLAILAKFRQVVEEMIRANKLTQQEEPRNVDEVCENGEFGESDDFGKISPRLLTK